MSGNSMLLQCRELSCGYDGQIVLRDITMSVRRQHILAVLGGSGSGKSTLLRTIGGLLPPVQGEVFLFGRSLYDLSPEERRPLLQRTGMVFQHDALFGSMTVLENLLLPLRELTNLPEQITRQVARAKLALVELEELAARYPSQLSGGQRKRIALARATILDPEILFCDEPTSGLDPVTAAQIDSTLRSFADVLGVGIVAITHDVDSVQHVADSALVLDQGRRRAEGSIRELQQSNDSVVRGFFNRGRQTERVSGNAEASP